MTDESQLLTAIDSGIQTVIPVTTLASPQTVYLDFDGASASYFNRDLDIVIDDVKVVDSGFGEDDILYIIKSLNGQFEDMVFTFKAPPKGQDFSTIYIGRTDAFDAYGDFLGLAETIDSGNQIRDDNAFVLLDSTASRDMVTSVIAHETQHIVSGMQHDGEGLGSFALTSAYANQFTINTNETFDPHYAVIVYETDHQGYISPDPIFRVKSGGTLINFELTSTNFGGGHGWLIFSAILEKGAIAKNIILNGGHLECLGNNDLYDFDFTDGKYNFYSSQENDIRFHGSRNYVKGSAVVTGVQITDMARFIVSNGGEMISTTLTSNRTTSDSLQYWGGRLLVSNGGRVRYTTVNKDGILSVSSGGVANTTTVNSSGDLTVDHGGTATDTIVNSGGQLKVFSGGTATDTIVNLSGHLTVISGGVATSTTVNSSGDLTVDHGGTATDTIVNLSGQLTVLSGGVATSTTINSSGCLVISCGGTATDITAVNGATLCFAVAPDTYIQGTYNASAFEMKNAAISGFSLNSGGQLKVFNGGTATDTIVNSSGYLYVYSGGTATDTIVNLSGQLTVISGGVATSTTVNSSGYLYVYSGGTATDTIVNLSGHLTVISGGVATSPTVNSSGDLYVHSGGTAIDITAVNGAKLRFTVAPDTYIQGTYNASAFEMKNAAISGFSLNSGRALYVHSGGTATDTIVNSGGYLSVDSGGTATDTIVNSNGDLHVYSGGTANTTTIKSGGLMSVRSGGTATDTAVTSGGYLWVDSGAILLGTVDLGGTLPMISGVTIDTTEFNLHLEEHAANEQTVMVNDISMLSNVAVTVIVDVHQKDGAYILGGNANAFTGSITVKDTSGATHGVLSVGETLKGTNATYYLENTNDKLIINIANIDNTAPVITLTCDTATPLQKASITATTEAGLDIYYSTDGNTWEKYAGKLDVTTNGTWYFKATDAAGNVGTNSIEFKNIDAVAPVIELTGDTTTALQKSSIAATTEDGVDIYYSTDNETWEKYTGRLDVTSNGTWHFKATDAAENVGTNSIEFKNIDTVAPTLSDVVISEPDANAKVSLSFQCSVDVIQRFYSLDGGDWLEFAENELKVEKNCDVRVKLIDSAYNESVSETFSVNGFNTELEGLGYTEIAGTSDSIELFWNKGGRNRWTKEYALALSVNGQSIDIPQIKGEGLEIRGLTEVSISWNVAPVESEISTNGPNISFYGTSAPEPQIVQTLDNEITEVLLARKFNTWNGCYQARHVGSIGDWDGTDELTALKGKNQIADVFVGSLDPSLLYLTDDSNGDALFVEDIYTELPDTLQEQQARIAQIDSIYAGAGDDLIDMTSQRFEYIGGGVTIYGGLGNDTLWANKGNNTLFGDAGDDRLVGASGNDIIVGGIGNDSMHGGGGNDIFCFSNNWGQDTIEQLASGDFCLWFSDGITADDLTFSANGDDTLVSLTDTDNTILVKNISVAGVQARLFFGEAREHNGLTYSELSDMGAFSEFTSEKIFEDKNKGLLA